MSDEIFEFERPYQRPELAALFQEFATALTEGRSLAIETSEGIVSIEVPPEVSVELELEVEEEDEREPEGDAEETEEGDAGETRSQTVEFELELEWDDPARSSVRVDAANAEFDTQDSSESHEEVGDTDSLSESPATERRSTFEVYRDKAGQWRWRLVHWNGNIIADSGEGYTTRASALNGLESVKHNAPGADVDSLE